ncbi:MAG: hypothetical protein HFJ28_02715 [Clostridia bacterium]|jgi:hypothetical protein|nr:hypothetical protein [Clostridia bacterium]MCI9177495.1 hypothetical protein [Clostridia bacterium]
MKRKGEIRNIAIILAMVITVTIVLYGVVTFAMTTFGGNDKANETTVADENPYLDAFLTAQNMESYRLFNEYLHGNEIISDEEYLAVFEEFIGVTEEILKKGEISKERCKKYNKMVKELLEAEQNADKIIVGDEESLEINSGTIDKVGFADGLEWGQINITVSVLRESYRISEEQYAEFEDKMTETYIEILNGGDHQTASNFFDYADEFFRQAGVDTINTSIM